MYMTSPHFRPSLVPRLFELLPCFLIGYCIQKSGHSDSKSWEWACIGMRLLQALMKDSVRDPFTVN